MNDEKSNNLSASLEDYLEVIFNLTAEANPARSRDIAETLGVSRASVTGALRQLKKKELANYEPYGYITLTDAGKSAAAEIAKKHNILKSFFMNVLGVEKYVAQKAACRAEHTLGPNVITRLLHFIEFVTQTGSNGHDLAEEFRQFCEDKSGPNAETESREGDE